MVIQEPNYFKHTGVKGMKWGIRKQKESTGPNNLVDRNDFATIKKYKMAIIGEIHKPEMIDYYDKLLSEKKPKNFICEFADQDRCYDRKTLKDRMDKATDGSWGGKGADYQYNYWAYALAYKHNTTLIGCNTTDYKKTLSMDKEDKVREAYMLKTIKEFEGTNSVVQLGDHHLRSIPISKDFLESTGTKVDDRGIVTDLTVSNSSPVWDYFSNKADTCISRVPEEYKTELDFNKEVKHGGNDMNDNNTLEHVGVLGMHWGRRKGSSSSAKPPTRKQHVAKVGKKLAGPNKKVPRPYGKPDMPPKRLTDVQLRSKINRIEMEKKYALLTAKQVSPAKKMIMDILSKAAKDTATTYVTKMMGKGMAKALGDSIPSTPTPAPTPPPNPS